MAFSAQNQLTPALSKPLQIRLLWGGAFLLLCLVFRTNLNEILTVWIGTKEYNHGFFIPCISAYLIWIKRAELQPTTQFKDSAFGLSLMALSLVMLLFGSLTTIKTIEQYAFLIALVGLFAAAFGVHGLRIAAFPFLFLIFMVPLPPFIFNNLTIKLQFISSMLGVEFIRAFDIMVFLEGNIIDLGRYKLKVVEACSGLRYLFPLASLAFLCAYLFKGAFWQRLLIFLSSPPLLILISSLRIGIVGVLSDKQGMEIAKAFLHGFEGWAVFLLCIALLFLEIWVLSRFNGRKPGIWKLLQLPVASATTLRTDAAAAVLNQSVFAVLLLLSVGAGASEVFKNREDVIPQRMAFSNFPMQIGPWLGRSNNLAQNNLDELKLTDYVLADFSMPGTPSRVNFYSAYYQTQRKGAAVHSPRSCIPGDGWQITDYDQREFPELKLDGKALQVDRAIVERGDKRQLVYFWFQQRGRDITNEYMMKWYLFYDALTMSRTDGALIRVVTGLDKTEDVAVADQRLQAFIKDLLPELAPYLPGKTIVQAGYADPF